MVARKANNDDTYCFITNRYMLKANEHNVFLRRLDLPISNISVSFCYPVLDTIISLYNIN